MFDLSNLILHKDLNGKGIARVVCSGIRCDSCIIWEYQHTSNNNFLGKTCDIVYLHLEIILNNGLSGLN